MLRFVPYANGLSLDAMRRSDEAPNGLTEALVCTALEHARDQGLCEVSLNFAGFGHLMAPSRRCAAGSARPRRLCGWPTAASSSSG